MEVSMRRIFSVLAVTALTAAMLVASAMPAFAVSDNTPNCRNGQSQAAGSGNKDFGNFFKHFLRVELLCE